MSAEANELIQHLQEELGLLRLRLENVKAPEPPGVRFAIAGNELVQGIQRIQFIVHRAGTPHDLMVDIADICEALVGPYKIIVADLSREDFNDSRDQPEAR